MKVVIIGTGPAGIAAAETMRAPTRPVEIEMVRRSRTRRIRRRPWRTTS